MYKCSVKTQIKDIIRIALFSRFLVFLIAVISHVVIPKYLTDVPEIKIPFFGLFAKWDSFFYIGIAARGYSASNYFWAFRPFYPLITRLLCFPFEWILFRGSIDRRGEAILILGVLWNLFAFTLATVYFYKFTKLLFDHKTAYYSVLSISLFPSTIFFTAVYPEATYLLLIVTSFYYLEKKSMFQATLLATLASFTRPEGLFTFIPFFIKSFNEKGKKRIQLWFSSIIILSSIFIFFLYSYFITGDLYISLQVEKSWPKITLIKFIKNLLYNSTHSLSEVPTYIISSFFLIICILSVIQFYYKYIQNTISKTNVILNDRDAIKPYYVWYTILLCMFIYIGEYTSFTRYVSTLLPIHWFFSFWSEGKLNKTYSLLSLYSVFMTLGTIFFISWYKFI